MITAFSGSVGLAGDLADDAARLAVDVKAAEDGLDRLPRRPDRDVNEQRTAETLLAAARKARLAFLTVHVDRVYDELTGARTRHLRLADLLTAAVDRFPGVVPGPRRMAAELALIQSERDGLEIDQALFCSAVLRSPRAGSHLIDAMLRPIVPDRLRDEFRATGSVRLPSVGVERQGATAHVTFHNGHALNAEDGRLIADLETAVDLVLLDERTRVGVLRGGSVEHPRYAGRRVFSAGINLKHLRDGRISFVDFLMGRELGYLHKIVRGLLVEPAAVTWSDRTVAKPWIGAVDSFAIGGGMQLLLVLDRVIAETGSFFSLPAADEGIVPGLGNLRLTRATGTRLARRIILGGERLEAGTPEAAAVCDEVVRPDEMDAAIARAAASLAAPGITANRRMLTLAEEPVELYRQYLAEFAVAQSIRAYSPDVLAKVERRRSPAESKDTGR
ncbi:(3,5-dihydroxyphenyl)acetyl-CoA 1,2-dioxygenase DpgC [Actinoplanes sp. L3-i22]|uniref:(3,5-dihydroxyphenyl)acetyl-CoA 1,2-dioxygenase DpgC n=1 Tax=Actinoplanes sp. L3-i22 TaxID=2836373 RepID=UPI001C778DEC|nr:(3,5-dihydroxyphenyl)acetyl-CoA 1,2-dioxygenase DpgC [Actinoplanes sp. L3-i22]BCY14194.1 hypothetical protein L3i22_092820 [Actinoplanes sp. L3-i22]